ncbi:MAG TPA: flavin reductase, partial [Elusimicrobiota bacterium]|nr:flavin reductase [Elusimicrobiota bacterium]
MRSDALFADVPLAEWARLINHGPCVIVTSGDAARANAAPAQWNMPVNDDPPVAGVALDGDNFTSELVQKTGEFVLNVPDESLLPAIKI